MKNIHIGPLPPPLGGVSVYLYRLSKIKKDDIFCDEGNLSKASFLKMIFFRKNCNFIFHGMSIKKMIFMYFSNFLRRNKYSFVFHGEGFIKDYKKGTLVKKYIFKNILFNAVSLQVVNDHIKDCLIKILPDLNGRILVKHAFLEPPIQDEKQILSSYPVELFHYLKSHSPIIIANAYKLVFWDGNDLYGLDMCVKLIKKIKSSFPKVGLIFALADEGDGDYLNQIKEKIALESLENNIYFLTGQKELWPLFKKADLMVRPTCTDGDAVSIREALYFACPVVASDVCKRPEGTVVYAARNQDDFYEEVRGILKDKFEKEYC